jgi:hypothetical protein
LKPTYLLALAMMMAGMSGCSKSIPVGELRAAGISAKKLSADDYLKLLNAKAKAMNVGWEIHCNEYSSRDEYTGWAWRAGHHAVYVEDGGMDTWWVFNKPSQDDAVEALYERLSDGEEPDHNYRHAKTPRQCKEMHGGPQ